MAALPALINDNDAVLIDQFAHASLQLSTELLQDVPVRLVRHNRIDQVEALLAQLSTSFERIWYLVDGLYSMFGDFAPFDDIAHLLERWPQLHVYIDDAHATTAKLHLTPEHARAQAELMRRIDHTLATAEKFGLELATQHRTPIFFIPHDSVRHAVQLVRALINSGFFVCPSAFPAVPMNRPGVRFTVTLHNELDDIDELIAAASETSPKTAFKQTAASG
jgi:7-keto-8-aminopelargonate synthetase-like enzyme